MSFSAACRQKSAHVFDIPGLWPGWWLGNIIGVLISAPLLLFGTDYRMNSVSRFSRIKLEFILVIGCCISLTWLVFGGITAIVLMKY